MQIQNNSFNIFNIFEYIKRLKEANFTESQAQVIAELIEKYSQANDERTIANELAIEKQAERIKEQQREIETQQYKLDIIQSKEPATKNDLSVIEYKIVSVYDKVSVVKKELQIEIEKLRYDTLKFIVWTGATVVITLVGTLGGIMAKGFGWF